MSNDVDAYAQHKKVLITSKICNFLLYHRALLCHSSWEREREREVIIMLMCARPCACVRACVRACHKRIKLHKRSRNSRLLLLLVIKFPSGGTLGRGGTQPGAITSSCFLMHVRAGACVYVRVCACVGFFGRAKPTHSHGISIFMEHLNLHRRQESMEEEAVVCASRSSQLENLGMERGRATNYMSIGTHSLLFFRHFTAELFQGIDKCVPPPFFLLLARKPQPFIHLQ